MATAAVSTRLRLAARLRHISICLTLRGCVSLEWKRPRYAIIIEMGSNSAQKLSGGVVRLLRFFGALHLRLNNAVRQVMVTSADAKEWFGVFRTTRRARALDWLAPPVEFQAR